jgi:hypothetical protein
MGFELNWTKEQRENCICYIAAGKTNAAKISNLAFCQAIFIAELVKR